MKKEHFTAKLWIWIDSVFIVALIIAEFYSDKIIAESKTGSDIGGFVAGLVSFGAIVTFILCCISFLKLKGLQKLIATVGIIVSTVIFVWSFFVASFSGGLTF